MAVYSALGTAALAVVWADDAAVLAVLAKSYADLTELGVAAVVTDVLAVESVSCTAPDCAVVAAWIAMLTLPAVPPPVIGAETVTAVMSPVSLAIHSSPVAVAELTLKT